MSPRDSSRTTGVRKSDSRWTLVTCVLASSLSFVEGSVLSVALPAIRTSYGAGAELIRALSSRTAQPRFRDDTLPA